LLNLGGVAYFARMSSFPVTPDGHEKLKQELARLKNVDRRKISLEIGAARELGDLSENFEYHAAKNRQGMIEARIRDLEDKLARAQVIDPSKLSGDRVVFGATVKLAAVESGDEITYQLVGEVEADVDAGRISVTSAVGRALVGKEVGDEVRIPGKGGPRMVEIVDVKFG
jgi:transcription elongation factor GreA